MNSHTLFMGAWIMCICVGVCENSCCQHIARVCACVRMCVCALSAWACARYCTHWVCARAHAFLFVNPRVCACVRARIISRAWFIQAPLPHYWLFILCTATLVVPCSSLCVCVCVCVRVYVYVRAHRRLFILAKTRTSLSHCLYRAETVLSPSNRTPSLNL